MYMDTLKKLIITVDGPTDNEFHYIAIPKILIQHILVPLIITCPLSSASTIPFLFASNILMLIKLTEKVRLCA